MIQSVCIDPQRFLLLLFGVFGFWVFFQDGKQRAMSIGEGARLLWWINPRLSQNNHGGGGWQSFYEKGTYDDGQKEVILISDVNVCILDKDADAKHQCKLANNRIRRAKARNKKRCEDGLPVLPLVKTLGGLFPLEPWWERHGRLQASIEIRRVWALDQAKVNAS